MEVQYDTYSVSIPYRRRSRPARLRRGALLLLGLALYSTLILAFYGILIRYCLKHTNVVAQPPGNAASYELPAMAWPHS